MSEEKRNRLANETSSYLRSASHQPVDWYPWCEEAFQKAKELDRPVLLDIGAVWCHVIDRESYEDEEIARWLDISNEKVRELIESGKSRLFEARKRRPTPYVDKILYTNWNAMMVSAFLLAYKVQIGRAHV